MKSGDEKAVAELYTQTNMYNNAHQAQAGIHRIYMQVHMHTHN